MALQVVWHQEQHQQAIKKQEVSNDFLGSLWVHRCYQYYQVVYLQASTEFEVVEEIASKNNLCGTTIAKNWKKQKKIKKKQTKNLDLVQPEMALTKIYYSWWE